MNMFSHNGSYTKISIEKKSVPQWIMFFILFFPFAFGLFTEILRLPDFIKFISDALLAFLCIVFLLKGQLKINKKFSPLVIAISVFLVYTLIVYCFRFQSPFYYLWGLRNTFRFYIALFFFLAYIDENAANDYLSLFDVLFWINFFVSLFQFFFMGIRQDYLGGIFGTRGGTNGFTLMFFCIIITRSLILYFNGIEKSHKTVLKIVATLLIAAMAEMKFYFVAFIIMLIIASVITKFTKKKFFLILISIVFIAIGATLLSFMFDEFDNFISLENIIESATKENYSSENDINRLSAIFTLAKNYVTSIPSQIFGLGLGNCDTSEIPMFNSVFFQSHSSLHYTWFSSAMLFLETGIIGLVLYFSIFFICIALAHKNIKQRKGNLVFCQMAIIMAVMCCIITIYNSSLRLECGYMAYFVLTLPFISVESAERNNK